MVKFQVSQNKEILSTKQSFISIPVKSCECFSPKPVIDLQVKKVSSAWNEICFAAEDFYASSVIISTMAQL